MLNGNDPSVGKTSAIPRIIDLVYDRRIDIAGPQKIRVQRMGGPLTIDRGASRGQSLTQDLPTEDLWRTDIPALSSKDIVINLFQFKQIDQVRKYRVHFKAVLMSAQRDPTKVRIDNGDYPMNDTPTTKRPRGTRWCKTAIVLAIIAGIAMIIGLGGGVTGALGPMPAFGAFGIGLPLFVLAILTSLIGLALSKGTAGDASTRGTWAAFGIGVILMGTILSQAPSMGGPGIHDISTDVKNPPLFVAVVALRGASSNPAEYLDDGTAEQQLEAYPDIQTLIVERPTDQVFDAAEDAARALGWEIVAANRDSGRIEATDTTFWFGFKDDVVIRLTPRGSGTNVDIRSKSRVGRGDMGANAARIRRFLQNLSDVMGA